jgi:hypothetical protein
LPLHSGPAGALRERAVDALTGVHATLGAVALRSRSVSVRRRFDYALAPCFDGAQRFLAALAPIVPSAQHTDLADRRYPLAATWRSQRRLRVAYR